LNLSNLPIRSNITTIAPVYNVQISVHNSFFQRSKQTHMVLNNIYWQRPKFVRDLAKEQVTISYCATTGTTNTVVSRSPPVQPHYLIFLG
jgi:hypothetical protein